uniref:Uncharacterized protein n=1 Tax=Romanomermis culicivorax TaxID=13658 RepID=A0A915IY26_ROMCU
MRILTFAPNKCHNTLHLPPRKALQRKHINLRLSYEGGVRLIMRKILRDNPFVCWGHNTLKKKEKRLNYPL